MAKALMTTLHELLGEFFTKEVEFAWQKAFLMLALHMIQLPNDMLSEWELLSTSKLRTAD